MFFHLFCCFLLQFFCINDPFFVCSTLESQNKVAELYMTHTFRMLLAKILYSEFPQFDGKKGFK